MLCRKNRGLQRTSNSSLCSLAFFSSSSRSSFIRCVSFCDGVKVASRQIETKTCLEPCLALPSLLFFLLTFKFPLFLFLLRRSQNGTPSEEIGIATYLEFFLPFSSFLLFLLMFELLSPPFLLQSGLADIPSEEVGSRAPRVSRVPYLPSPSDVQVPFVSFPSATGSERRTVGRGGDHDVPRGLPRAL